MDIAKNSEQEVRLADLVREARIKERLSQRELGEKIGVWNTYVGQIEKGERVPSDEIGKKISAALNLDVTQVLLAIYEARAETSGSDEATILFRRMKKVLSDPVVLRLLDTESPIDPSILVALSHADVRALLVEEVWCERIAACYRMSKKRNILALLSLIEIMNDKQWIALVNMLDAMGLDIPQ